MVGSTKTYFLEKCCTGGKTWLQKSTKVPSNTKFVLNIPGWDAVEIQVIRDIKANKSSLLCWLKKMGQARISSIGMGQGSCYW